MTRTERAATRSKRNIGGEILAGIQEIKRGEHGRITTVPAVQQIRQRTGLSQSRFAELLGVSPRTLQEWEQGRRAPSGPARTLLLIASKNPQALLDVL
jgi:putative transcriptional regulator